MITFLCDKHLTSNTAIGTTKLDVNSQEILSQ